MWYDVGFSRIILLILLVLVGLCLGKRGRLWLAALAPLAIGAAFVPGNDPLSMILTFVGLSGVFALGVYWSPRLLPASKTARANGGTENAPA